MQVTVTQLGEWFAVVAPEGPVRTPMGTPVVSRHRALAEEVAVDASRWGADPTARTTTFSLQCSYLDFGLRVRREVMEENTAAIWPDDLFVRRPEDPGLAAALASLWGPLGLDRPRFRDALRSLTLRQVIAAMTAGQVLRSAVLGFVVITSARDLDPLVRGACGRHFEALARPLGVDPAAAVARRHVPTELDEAACAACCAVPGGPVGPSFDAGCALLPLFEKLRRWAAFPDEGRQGA